MYYPKSSVSVTGVAQIGRTDAINAMHGTFSLSLITDTYSDTIISFSCNMVMAETIEFVRQLLTGKNIVTDMDETIEATQKCFLALFQKALVVALHDAQGRYQMSMKEFQISFQKVSKLNNFPFKG